MVLLSADDLDVQAMAPKDGIFSCTIALAFSGIGAGILSLPWALSTCGLLGGMLVLAATACLSCLSSWVLLSARRQCPGAEGYAGVIASYWPHAWVVNLVVLLDCFGALVVFTDYCAEAVLGTVIALSWPVPPRAWIKAGFCMFAAPLSLPRSITRTASLSPLSLTALAYICGVIVLQAFSTHDPGGPEGATVELFELSSSSLQGTCAFFFAFVSHMNLFDVTSSLKNPTPQRKKRVALLATLLMLGAYALVSACGYAAFGSEVNADVLANFPPTRFDVKLANMAMVGMLLVCFILVVYPVRSALLGLLSSQQEFDSWAWFTTTLLIGMSTAMVAISFPSIVSALSILGGFCAPCIVFVFPALTLRFSEAPGRASALYGAALVGFGALVQGLLKGAGLVA